MQLRNNNELVKAMIPVLRVGFCCKNRIINKLQTPIKQGNNIANINIPITLFVSRCFMYLLSLGKLINMAPPVKLDPTIKANRVHAIILKSLFK